VSIAAASRLGQSECIAIIPHFHASDPLRHHLVLVLQAASTAAGEAEHVYADVLTNALAVHFLRRYATAVPSAPAATGGLSPHKLRHITTYIQEHLEQELSLVELAAAVQLSPTYFARQFKHTTGLAPHQYVVRCRIERARQLLVDTALPLIEVGQRVGFLDQSHFIAVFRRHVGMTPRAYRAQAQTTLG
jgi:AraC family transcriptional regulator